MSWNVKMHSDFYVEALALDPEVHLALAQRVARLQEEGPSAGRPGFDSMAGTSFVNLREMRFEAASTVWRIAYAFDPRRKSVLLLAGEKSGGAQKRVQRALVGTAEGRFQSYLDSLD